MKNSKCSVMAAIALCAFVLSAMTLEAQAQSSNRGGRQSRVRAEPLPSPYPIPYSQRVEISPVPNPTARPVPSMEPVGIAPLPSPKPRPGVGRVGLDVGPVFSPALLDLLIDMHAEAVRRGDLVGADLLEELIVDPMDDAVRIIWPEF